MALATKVMATLFCNAEGVIYVDFLKENITINTCYYCCLKRKLFGMSFKEEAARSFSKVPVSYFSLTITSVQNKLCTNTLTESAWHFLSYPLLSNNISFMIFISLCH
jgi:hypothetical protein